jgi:hypothetical protein
MIPKNQQGKGYIKEDDGRLTMEFSFIPHHHNTHSKAFFLQTKY